MTQAGPLQRENASPAADYPIAANRVWVLNPQPVRRAETLLSDAGGSHGRDPRFGSGIGVEITGVDVKTMDEASWNKIYQAWLDHNVMCVRDQELTIPISCATAAASAGHPAPVEIDAASGLPAHHDAGRQQIRRVGQIARRDLPARRRGLAHRRRVQPGAFKATSSTPSRCRARRQHHVCQRYAPMTHCPSG